MRFPKTLYKYVSLQNELNQDKRFQKRILTNFELFFACPKRFNDPFDCKILRRYDLMTFDERIDWIYEKVIEENPKLYMDQIHDLITKKYNLNLLKSDDYMEFISHEYTKMFMANHGVFCTTPKNDNLLMWSHYGDSHQGFCIGLDKKLLYDHVMDKASFFSVHYTNKYPIIKANRNKDETINNIFIQLTTKSKQWQYEREYRFIMPYKPDYVVKLDKNKEIFKSIIFGSEMKNDTQKELTDRVKRDLPNIKIYKAEKSKDNFKLDIKLIN